MKLIQVINILTAVVGVEAMEAAKKDLVNVTCFLPKATANTKVGAMTGVYSSRATCPAGCPFKTCGACYAENGNCKNWFNVASGQAYKNKYYHINIVDLKKAIGGQATTKYIRHNVSGDLCTNNSVNINPALVAELITAYQGHKAYTYTHAPITARNMEIIKAANKSGVLVINKSCENLNQVKACIAAGVPAVLAVDKMPKNKTVIDGIKFEKCPATYKDGITCASCKKCANCNRSCVMVFPVHGARANNARKAGFLIDELK